MQLLDKNGNPLVGKLKPDHIRMIDALSHLGEGKHVTGIIEGIHIHKGISREVLMGLIDGLQELGYVQDSKERGKVLSAKGWSFLHQHRKNCAKERKIQRKIIGNSKKERSN